MEAKLPLRPNVCMLVFNRQGRIFLGERFKEAGVWQFPQGGVEPNLSLEENVLRELEEELGAPAKHFHIVKRLEATHEYEFQSPPDYAVGRWRGQAQTFWLVEYSGPDQAIKFEQDPPEFTRFKWCTPDEVRALAERKRLPGYVKPLNEFEEFMNRRVSNL